VDCSKGGKDEEKEDHEYGWMTMDHGAHSNLSMVASACASMHFYDDFLWSLGMCLGYFWVYFVGSLGDYKEEANKNQDFKLWYQCDMCGGSLITRWLNFNNYQSTSAWTKLNIEQ